MNLNLNILNTFLNKNPKLLSKYVNVSMTVIGAALVPMTKVVKHCLVIQGLDPNTNPGEKERLALRKALDEDLNKLHEKDFDDDFNWSKKSLNKAQAQFPDMDLTKENYYKLTDLSNLVSPPSETRLYATTAEKEVTDDEPSRPTRFTVHPDAKPMPEFDTDSLKQAIKKLREFAASYKDAADEEEQMIAQKNLSEAGTELLEIKRAKHQHDLDEEIRTAFDPVVAKYPRKSLPSIKKHKKGSFSRVTKKKK